VRNKLGTTEEQSTPESPGQGISDGKDLAGQTGQFSRPETRYNFGTIESGKYEKIARKRHHRSNLDFHSGGS